MSSSSASGTVSGSTSTRPSSGILCDMLKLPTKTSTWRSFASSMNSSRSLEFSALNVICGS